MDHRSYYAIIPANVRYDDSLIPSAKLLYGEITALCNEKGYCWASNEYFANQYKVSKPTIQNWLKSLEEKGYIYREVRYKVGSKEIEARYIRILGGGHQENLVGGHQEIYQDNNTSFNNTFNNIDHSSSKLKNDFDKLWKLYPRKKGKTAAFKHYKKAIKDGATNKQIQDGILSYKKEIETKKIEESYIKHGSTWFSNRGWEDEYDYSVNTKKTISDEIAESQRRIAEAYEQ
ncbi:MULTISPECIES: helix-turn-helix domain-containing protein [Enterococcus]|uniref:helix-turn-helix domain-containing protein n=1 Tax=Enterococcus TaxID=1350 RepID=UPI001F20624E|nr:MULTISPECIES: helix-turn-helix domain-containing protein [Enterococcus]MCV3197078.1 helix-turn-helix domain-containing protein [Enterococcus faecium]MDW3723789.1 helix-turn-helix domain-containing protein [Enterococcus faecium]UJM30704.1 helix-turn-helix domain-containing protein [Enterococcus faecium]